MASPVPISLKAAWNQLALNYLLLQKNVEVQPELWGKKFTSMRLWSATATKWYTRTSDPVVWSPFPSAFSFSPSPRSPLFSAMDKNFVLKSHLLRRSLREFWYYEWCYGCMFMLPHIQDRSRLLLATHDRVQQIRIDQKDQSILHNMLKSPLRLILYGFFSQPSGHQLRRWAQPIWAGAVAKLTSRRRPSVSSGFHRCNPAPVPWIFAASNHVFTALASELCSNLLLATISSKYSENETRHRE